MLNIGNRHTLLKNISTQLVKSNMLMINYKEKSIFNGGKQNKIVLLKEINKMLDDEDVNEVLSQRNGGGIHGHENKNSGKGLFTLCLNGTYNTLYIEFGVELKLIDNKGYMVNITSAVKGGEPSALN